LFHFNVFFFSFTILYAFPEARFLAPYAALRIRTEGKSSCCKNALLRRCVLGGVFAGWSNGNAAWRQIRRQLVHRRSVRSRSDRLRAVFGVPLDAHRSRPRSVSRQRRRKSLVDGQRHGLPSTFSYPSLHTRTPGCSHRTIRSPVLPF